jgi:hypothetical protein
LSKSPFKAARRCIQLLMCQKGIWKSHDSMI